MLAIIVAVDENNAIGKDNKLLWHISEDLKHFKSITNGHPVIMGRKTFESIGKPLPNRTNIIVTHNHQLVAPGCIIVSSLENALTKASEIDDNKFIIGGASIFEQTVRIADTIYLTIVHKRYDADTFFPEIPGNEWTEIERIDFEKGINFDYPFSFCKLRRISFS
jgi:dihydrofolate reductase